MRLRKGIEFRVNNRTLYLSPHPSPLPLGPAYVAKATSAEWAERGRVRGNKMLEENSQI
jgi:hypothetical protein